MQLSRTLRCLHGHRPLFRCFYDAIKRTGQDPHSHHQQQPLPCAALLLNYFKSQYSTKEGNDTQSLQSSASLAQDSFDISKLLDSEETPQQSVEGSARINALLTEWYSEVQKAKKDNRSETTSDFLNNEVQAQLKTMVHLALKDNAPDAMKLKCLTILLYYDQRSTFINQILRQTVREAQYLSIKSVADIIHLLTISGSSQQICRHTRKDLVLTIVDKRWFEIGPKHILFFMYQLDELWDMKLICQRNRKQGKGGSSSEASSHHEQIDTAVTETAKSGVRPVTANINNVNIEKRLIGLVEKLKPKDLARVLTLMGKWRSRNQVLVMALIHRLSIADISDFSLIQLSNLLFSCSILSIHKRPLLDKLSKELTSRQFMSTSSVCSILSSLSYLRWYDVDLVSKCLSYLALTIDPRVDGDRGGGVAGKEAWSILKSLANLYALPRSDDEAAVIKSLAQTSFTKATSPIDKVDTAWCQAVLKALDGSTATAVLDNIFHKQFLDATNIHKRMALQKLRGVSLSARYELEGYQGPLMEDGVIDDPQVQEKSVAHTVLSNALREALGKFLDMESYVRMSQSLPGGLHADAVLCVGQDGMPKPLTSLEEPQSGIHHMAIQVIPFSSIRSSNDDINNTTTTSTTKMRMVTTCGWHQLAARHLRYLGYLPVQIPYSDLRKSQSVLEHINAIQSRIKMAAASGSKTTTTTPTPDSS